MAKFKIVHERPECIGCGACTAIAPKFWKMNDDGSKSDLIGAKDVDECQERELNDLENNMEVAETCPINCIHIYENGKKKI